jgi:hypothetical protein
MTLIVSKFRPLFWIKMVATLIGWVFTIGICIYFSIINGRLDFFNILFWLACFFTLSLIVYLLKFLFVEYREFTVSDEGIMIKYLISNEETSIHYEDIKKFTPKNITSRQGANTSRTAGYFEIEMELDNGQLITFNEVQFINYSEIKNFIFQRINI